MYKKITRLNKPYYVTNEYGHSDAMLVKKINVLIDIVNQQQREITQLKNIINNKRKGGNK